MFALIDEKFQWFEKNHKTAKQLEKDLEAKPKSKAKAKAKTKAKAKA